MNLDQQLVWVVPKKRNASIDDRPLTPKPVPALERLRSALNPADDWPVFPSLAWPALYAGLREEAPDHPTEKTVEAALDDADGRAELFDLSLDIISDGYEIAAVYGSPNADRATGEMMHVTTLFPSPTEDGDTRGGVTLVQLRQTDPDASLELVAEWIERDGTTGRDTTDLEFPVAKPEHFDHSGIRKAVVLTRYARLLRGWARAVRDDDVSADDGRVDDWQGTDSRSLGEWEERSVPLVVPDTYRSEFETLRDYVARERDRLGDETLDREVEVLESLTDPNTPSEESKLSSDDDESHPDTCPNCGTDISMYGPGRHLCPECGIEVR